MHVVATASKIHYIAGRSRGPCVPLYFLHFTEGDEFFPDPEGIERRDLEAIQRAAIQGVNDLIADAVKTGKRDYKGRLDVENEQGEGVLTVTFACPVHIEVTRPSINSPRHQARPDEDKPC